MTFTPIAPLVTSADRLLQIDQRLCHTPWPKEALPAAFAALMVDPISQLSRILGTLSDQTASGPAAAEPIAPVRDTTFPVGPPQMGPPDRLTPDSVTVPREEPSHSLATFNLVSPGSGGLETGDPSHRLTQTPSPLSMFFSHSGVSRTMAALNVPLFGAAPAMAARLTRRLTHQKNGQSSEVNSAASTGAPSSEPRAIVSSPQWPSVRQADDHDQGENRDHSAREMLASQGGAMSPGAPQPGRETESGMARVSAADLDRQQVATAASQKMVQSTSQIAAVLHANIKTAAAPSAPPRDPQVGAEPEQVPAIPGQEAGTAPPESTSVPYVKSQIDMEELINRLAEHLEFEFIRTYGTSGW